MKVTTTRIILIRGILLFILSLYFLLVFGQPGNDSRKSIFVFEFKNPDKVVCEPGPGEKSIQEGKNYFFIVKAWEDDIPAKQ